MSSQTSRSEDGTCLPGRRALRSRRRKAERTQHGKDRNGPVVLGIDPGTSRIGFGVVRGSEAPVLMDCGLLRVTPSLSSSFRHLQEILADLDRLIRKHRPSIIAVEKLYVAKNSKAALAIAEARGVILLAAERRGIPLIEYAPSTVKKAVAGYGAADKKGVARMVRRILRVPIVKEPDDVSDALAIAITAASERRFRRMVGE